MTAAGRISYLFTLICLRKKDLELSSLHFKGCAEGDVCVRERERLPFIVMKKTRWRHVYDKAHDEEHSSPNSEKVQTNNNKELYVCQLNPHALQNKSPRQHLCVCQQVSTVFLCNVGRLLSSHKKNISRCRYRRGVNTTTTRERTGAVRYLYTTS